MNLASRLLDSSLEERSGPKGSKFVMLSHPPRDSLVAKHASDFIPRGGFTAKKSTKIGPKQGTNQEASGQPKESNESDEARRIRRESHVRLIAPPANIDRT